MGPPQRQMVPQSAPPHIQQHNNFSLHESPPINGTPTMAQQQSPAPNSTPGTPVRMQQFVLHNNHAQQQMFSNAQPVRMVQQAPLQQLPPQQQQQQPQMLVHMQPQQQQQPNGMPSVLLQQQQQQHRIVRQPDGVQMCNKQASPQSATAKPLHVQRLEALLDVNPFLDQLEKLLSSPIRIPNRSLAPASGSSTQNPPPNSVFSVKGIWSSEAERRKELCKLHNFQTLSKRQWLKDVLLEESDSESDGDQAIGDPDLNILLKIHKCRRKYQKKYHCGPHFGAHKCPMNSQYTYYGGGLLSEVDRFPQHQQQVLNEFGYGMSEHGDDETGRPSTSQSQHPPSQLMGHVVNRAPPNVVYAQQQPQLQHPQAQQQSPQQQQHQQQLQYHQQQQPPQQQQQHRPQQLIKTFASTSSPSSVPVSPLTSTKVEMKVEMLGMPMSSMISMGAANPITAASLLEDAVDPLLEE